VKGEKGGIREKRRRGKNEIALLSCNELMAKLFSQSVFVQQHTRKQQTVSSSNSQKTDRKTQRQTGRDTDREAD